MGKQERKIKMELPYILSYLLKTINLHEMWRIEGILIDESYEI